MGHADDSPGISALRQRRISLGAIPATPDVSWWRPLTVSGLSRSGCQVSRTGRLTTISGRWADASNESCWRCCCWSPTPWCPYRDCSICCGMGRRPGCAGHGARARVPAAVLPRPTGDGRHGVELMRSGDGYLAESPRMPWTRNEHSGTTLEGDASHVALRHTGRSLDSGASALKILAIVPLITWSPLATSARWLTQCGSWWCTVFLADC